jgi:hypothetical protein
MRLQRYLDRLHTILTSRQDWVVETLQINEIVPDQAGLIDGRLRFWDDSLLEFFETLSVRNMILVKTRYAYHYQNGKEQLVFRYDNAPHHPQISTFPHHKHIVNPNTQVEHIEPTTVPDLTEVLREIREFLSISP